MASDSLVTPNGARRRGRPADHLSFGAALALFAIAAIVWLVTTQPASVLHLRPYGSDVPLSRGQVAVLISTMYGVLALAAGLFAICVHAMHWPAIANRESRAALLQLRADLHLLQARLARLRVLRTEIATYEARLRTHEPRADEAGHAVRSGRAIVDDIISELTGT